MPTSEQPNLATGTVVVVPFPYSDRLAEKRRPAVVVSGAAVAAAGYVWIAMITSARNARVAGDVPIEDYSAAGLGVASVIRPLKMACIEPTRILRCVGTLPADTAAQVYTTIRSLIGPA
ncbi:type II toxin-antitoxin system PemK/MazF family toxin [Methylobacterium sp. E-005]|uniref:type II toxin-antitoxin system PemK/MazF family toxin n=1 Tax=Methylobacterium sp. E-005 TaxID=2836549 RepID=UPI001FBBC841|nr:type II toxin-antitoxin system PemK/MazF family toxin [Methylobacterium sp. E-005]MCJ2084931.1 type II toxin-antitoxin system PemK/MazF family toxin [Methylobacterium sp. E-005]